MVGKRIFADKELIASAKDTIVDGPRIRKPAVRYDPTQYCSKKFIKFLERRQETANKNFIKSKKKYRKAMKKLEQQNKQDESSDDDDDATLGKTTIASISVPSTSAVSKIKNEHQNDSNKNVRGILSLRKRKHRRSVRFEDDVSYAAAASSESASTNENVSNHGSGGHSMLQEEDEQPQSTGSNSSSSSTTCAPSTKKIKTSDD